jgi:hypothetical protein
MMPQLREAGRVAKTEPVEIWQGMRKVALLNPPDLTHSSATALSNRRTLGLK